MKSKSRSFRVLVTVLAVASVGAFGEAQARQRAAPIDEHPARSQTAPTVNKVGRTPWGDPDLLVSWSNATTTPLERPAKYAGREFLTAEERRAQDQETAIGTDRREIPGSDNDVNGAYNAFWWERGWSDGRTSLIYDPPDGRIPPLSPDAKKRQAEADRINRANDDLTSSASYNGPEELPLYTRCIIRAPLPRVPTGYDNNYEIVQSPGSVAIFQEQIHETRIIPLDPRPHLDPGVRQWLGDSRGHWEGNTLVVETTNFNNQATFEGSTRNMVLVERWTRVADDRIDYRFAVSDPETWSKPWSASIAWNKTGMLYEYACNEDNYGVYGILAGARAQERAAKK
jgi:hypothetical protein